MFVPFAELTATLLNAVVPPTAPVNVVAPVSVIVSVRAPLMVSVKLMLSPLRVVFTPSVTASP
ncbi:hypothetical protein MCEGEM3_01996 [Oxalobacteraceae bacterium]